MKNIIFIIPFLLILASCQDKQEGFLLKGSIGGNAEGMKVLLADAYAYPFVILDSTVIQNGKFLLKGRIDSPGLYQLIIDRSGEGQEETMLASKFYLENSNISYTGHIDSLPTYYWNKERMTREPVITGSKEQDLYIQYQQENQALNQEFSQIYNQYLNVYHLPALEGKFHTQEGIALAKQITKLEDAKRDAQWAFIEKHPQSTVGYDLACQFLEGMYVNLTAAQIDRLAGLISTNWQSYPEKVAAFSAKAEKAKALALGSKYQDIELTNLKGEKVKLSSYIPSGKYVMLEFWASWCGPCRGEIPHLRHVYQQYKDKGFEIVSISLDSEQKDWLKAVQEEKMAWTQLCDPLMFNGPVTQTYNITGVPTCILLDKEGRIFKTDMRGAALDAVLQELYP